MFTEDLHKRAVALLASCKKKGLTLTTAESCTGGLIAALLTEIPGSSAVFERGFVTYSNLSKTQMLGVDADTIHENGAVSEAVATAMATGARQRAAADLSVSVTGIAGPDGGSKLKPVGTVCMAASTAEELVVATHHFSGNRAEIRLQAVEKALQMLEDSLMRSSIVSVA